MYFVHFTLQDTAKDETLRKECLALNDVTDESIRKNRRQQMRVTNATSRKAPWINAASWVNKNDEDFTAAQVLENAGQIGRAHV